MGRVRRPVLIMLDPLTISELANRRIKTGISASRQLENAFNKRRRDW